MDLHCEDCGAITAVPPTCSHCYLVRKDGGPAMRLQYLMANARYAVTFGDDIIALDKPDGGRERFFASRAAAVDSLAENGLRVARSGRIYSDD